MNRYELTLIIDPKLTITEAQDVVKKVEDSIKKNKGKVVSQITWGIKSFATPIKKRNSGYYYFIQFDLEPSMIELIYRVYRYERLIIRFLLVNLSRDKGYFEQLKINKEKEKQAREEARKEEIRKASKSGIEYSGIAIEAAKPKSTPGGQSSTTSEQVGLSEDKADKKKEPTLLKKAINVIKEKIGVGKATEPSETSSLKQKAGTKEKLTTIENNPPLPVEKKGIAGEHKIVNVVEENNPNTEDDNSVSVEEDDGGEE